MRRCGAVTLDDVRGISRRVVPSRRVRRSSCAGAHEPRCSCCSWPRTRSAAGRPSPCRRRVGVAGAGRRAAPARPATRLAIVPREGAAQSELRIGHLSARRVTPDYPALLVMNAVLGGQFVSRVNLKLREEKGYTYGARTGFDWRRGLAPFALQASVHTASTAEAIQDSLARARGHPRGASADRRGAVAGQGVADARVSARTSKPRSRSRGRSRSCPLRTCRTRTSRSSFRR